MKSFFCAAFLLLLCNHSNAQITITGTVSNKYNASLIGANIVVKGTTTGTITDLDGSFSLNIPIGATHIIVSYTGYEDKQIKLSRSNRNYNIILSLEDRRFRLQKFDSRRFPLLFDGYMQSYRFVNAKRGERIKIPVKDKLKKRYVYVLFQQPNSVSASILDFNIISKKDCRSIIEFITNSSKGYIHIINFDKAYNNIFNKLCLENSVIVSDNRRECFDIYRAVGIDAGLRDIWDGCENVLHIQDRNCKIRDRRKTSPCYQPRSPNMQYFTSSGTPVMFF